MTRELLAPSAVLDDGPAVVRRIAGPWLGVFWLSTLPLRIAQVHFFREVVSLSLQSRYYGDYLGGLAFIAFLLFLPAFYGRAVYVRACTLSLQSGGRVGREAWRVPLPQLLNSLTTTLLFEILFYLFLWTWVAAPFFALLSGLAAVTAHRVERAGLVRPLREIASFLTEGRLLLSMGAVFMVGLLLAFLNVYFSLRFAVWAGTGLAGGDAARWEHLLRPLPLVPIFPADILVWLLCLGGATLAIEPFWLASLSSFVHRSRLRETGEDLRLEFDALRREAAR